MSKSNDEPIVVNGINLKCPMPMLNLKKAIKENPGKPIVFKMGKQKPASDLQGFLDQTGIDAKVLETDYGACAEFVSPTDVLS